jgi:transposase
VVAITVTRTDLSLAELRAAAKRVPDSKQARRILAIAMVLDGYSREDAAQACGMDRQTLRDWVHRYNAAGLAGLADRPRSGRPASLTEAELAEVAGWVEQGADLATDGVVRFRRVDLRDRIAAKFAVYLHERSVGKLLKQLGYRRLSVRPLHPQTDLAAQATFKKKLCRARGSGAGRPRRRPTGRSLVRRRSNSWPAGNANPHLGQAGQPPARVMRPPL